MNDYRTTNDLGETRTWEELYEDNLLLNKAYKDLKQENKQLKEQIKWYEKENKHNQEIIVNDCKLLSELEDFIPKLIDDNIKKM